MAPAILTRYSAEAPAVPSGASDLTDALWQAIAEAWHRGLNGKITMFNGKSPLFFMGKVHYFNGIVGHTHMLTSAFYVGLLDGLLGVAGMMKLIYLARGSFPKIPCVKRTSKLIIEVIEMADVTSWCWQLVWLLLQLRLTRGGLLWIGVPCSSWIWLSRGSTRRCHLRPRGRKRYPFELLNKIALSAGSATCHLVGFELYAGWWFGTCFIFSIILGMSSSQLTFIFFRGVGIPPTSMPWNGSHGLHPPWLVQHWFWLLSGQRGHTFDIWRYTQNHPNESMPSKKKTLIWTWTYKCVYVNIRRLIDR